MTLSRFRLGTATDYSDVSDEVTFGIVDGSLNMPVPPANQPTRVVSFTVEIDGAGTYDLVLDALQQIQVQLDLAAEYRRRKSATWVMGGIQIGDSSQMSYVRILEGYATILPQSFSGPAIEVGRAWIGLQLVCLRAIRTAKQSLTATGTISNTAGTPGSPGNSGSGAVYIANVPGNEPALLRLRFIDLSGGSAVINRLRVGIIPRRGMGSGDFAGWQDATTASPGTSQTAETNRIGSNYAQLATSDVWQTAASFAAGSDAEINQGEFDAFLRCWSSAGTLRRPTGLTLGTKSSAGSLAQASYQVKVTSLDSGGNETDASDVVSFVISNVNDRQPLTWTVNGSGATEHRVYVKKDSDAWKYVATGSGSGSYNLDSIAGASTGDPPSVSDFVEPYVRLAYGDASLAVTEHTVGVQLQSGANPTFVYAGRVQLPPVPTGEDESVEAWAALGQAISGQSGAAPNAMFDGLVLMPAWPQACATYTGMTLATKREWWFETRSDGRTFCQLRSTSNQSAQGWAACTGQLALPPGDCLIVVIADVAGGYSNVVDAAYSLQVDYVPGFLQLRGTT